MQTTHSISKSYRTRRIRAPKYHATIRPSLSTHSSVTYNFSLLLFFPSYDCTPSNKTEFLMSQHLTEEEFQDNPTINWDAILWVKRPLELWVVQVILAMVSLTEALLLAYLGYKVCYSFLSQIDFILIIRYCVNYPAFIIIPAYTFYSIG